METILATAFGRKVDVQGGEADELTNAAKSFFSQAEEGQLASRDVLVMLNSEWFSCIIILYISVSPPILGSLIGQIAKKGVVHERICPWQQDYINSTFPQSPPPCKHH